MARLAKMLAASGGLPSSPGNPNLPTQPGLKNALKKRKRREQGQDPGITGPRLKSPIEGGKKYEVWTQAPRYSWSERRKSRA